MKKKMEIRGGNLKEIFLRLMFLFCGLTIAHLGVTLFLLANLGADPFNVADRSYIRAGTIICMFCGGPIIDFFMWLLNGLEIQSMGLLIKIPVL